MRKIYISMNIALLATLLAQLFLLHSMLMKEEQVEVTPPPETQQSDTPVPPVVSTVMRRPDPPTPPAVSDAALLEEDAATDDVSTESDTSDDAQQLTRAEEAAASMDLIMRLVVAEAGNQGYDGMRAVAQVIHDRRYNSTYNFGETFEEIIYDAGQFCTPYAGDIGPWMPTVAEACEAVFYDGEYVFDEPVHYFYRDDLISQSTRNWFETKKFVGVLGAHTFRSDCA